MWLIGTRWTDLVLFRQRRLLCHSLSVGQSSCIVGQIQLSLPKGILVILFNFFVNKQFFLSAQGKHTRRVEDRREDGKREKKMLLGAFVPFRTCVIAAFAFVFIIVFSESASALNDSQVKCSRTCVAENCNSVGIRYGKYCGVGWSGCPGEKPCDDLDACCKIHDECVDKKGLTNIKCHEKFKRCIKKVQKSAKVGFSRECPYDTVVPTMVQGMDMAILLSQLGGSKFEL
ncbi:probable phospholipase A2 homolog 1 [Citrus clementina]|uniref:probable phospholipase A2 homolog 1 n=1 Tax=Citrus clementina TaxID=85681 RepID=UPI000CED2858|nr:probable phospholipase A2 homolog 1 [Citrus x clementina]